MLEAAVRGGHLGVVELLCAGKADPNLCTDARPAVVDPQTVPPPPGGFITRRKPSPLLQSMLQARKDITSTLREYGAIPDLGSSVVTCGVRIVHGPELNDFDAKWFEELLRDSVFGMPSLQAHLVVTEGSIKVAMTLAGAPISTVKKTMVGALEGNTILDGLRDKFPQCSDLKVETLQSPAVVPAGHCDSAFANAVGLPSAATRLRVCKLCLDAGADVNSNLSRGMRPLQRAMDMGDTALVAEFLRRGATAMPVSPGTLGARYSANPLLRAAFVGDFTMFRTLYKTVVDFGSKEASTSGSSMSPQLLDTPNDDGDTPASILRDIHGLDVEALISDPESVLPQPIDQPTAESLMATLGERGQYTFGRQELGRILDEVFHLGRVYGTRYDAFLSLEIQRGVGQSKRGGAVTAADGRPLSSRGRPSTGNVRSQIGNQSRQKYNQSVHLSQILSQAPRYIILGQMDFERQRVLLEPRLLEVCKGTDMQLIKDLVVAKKVNVNCRGDAECQGVQLIAATPVTVASMCGNDQVVAQLLSLKADPNALGRTAEGGDTKVSPLTLAVTYGNASVLKLLVTRKAEISAGGNEGMALLRAVAIGPRYTKGSKSVEALVQAALR